tara:strand:+ start:348 stop:743 length:396 start_codon:yes stop_codon:yes gene_type:complete
MSLYSILFLFIQQVYAITADCNGTLIVTVDNNGPDKMSAIAGQFQLLMNDDGTAKMSISAPNMPTLNGTGKETGNEKKPWELSALDDGGNQFSGGFTTLDPLVSTDTNLYILLDMKSTSMVISGPMTCLMK